LPDREVEMDNISHEVRIRRESLLETAMLYRKSGLDVIPDHPTDKYPVGFPNWQTRVFSIEELSDCILNKGYGIGIRNLEGLDFDNVETPDINVVFNSWIELIQNISPDLIGKIVIERTQHGGYHAIWKCKTIEGNQKVAIRKPTVKELATNPHSKAVSFIETRGTGGQFVVSPTPGYVVIEGDWLSLTPITSDERQILLQCARSFDLTPQSKSNGNEVAYSNSNEVRPGDVFNQKDQAEALNLLKEAGWIIVYEKDNVQFLRRPGKDKGISATFSYIAPGIFYNFSTNGAPFEPGRAYTPFSILTLLKYSGDYSQAASDLAYVYGNANTIRLTKNKLETSWPNTLEDAAFYGVAGEFVRMISPHSESDPAALLLSFLVAIGSAIGNKPHFRVEADFHPTRIFGILVGPTAKGRKGTSWRYIENTVSSIDEAWKLNITSGLSSGEGLIWAARDPIYKTVPLKGNGASGYEQQITDVGISDKRVMIYEGEFASTLRVLGREGNTLSAIIRNAWDTGNLQALTKNSLAKATNAHISIIGHITKDELVKYLTESEAGNGFANRFLFFCVRRSKCLPFGGDLDPRDLEIFSLKLDGVISYAKEINEIKWEERTKKIWEKIYPSLSEGKPGMCGALTSRSEAYVIRLACIYSLLDRSNLIAPDHLAAALSVWKYAENSVNYIFQKKTGSSIADSILEALSNKPNGLTKTDLYSLFGKNISANQLSSALDYLEKGSHTKKVTTPTAGRQEERWYFISNNT